MSPKKVVGCRGGSRNVEGYWGFIPLLEHFNISKFRNFQISRISNVKFQICNISNFHYFKTLNFENLKSTESKTQVKGLITIHGVSKEITIDAIFTKLKDTILTKGSFMLALADFNIKIPAVVANNIAKEIKVTFEFNHIPYNKK